MGDSSGSIPIIKAGKNAIIRIITGTAEAINTELYLNDVRVLSTSNTVIQANDLRGDGEYKGVCEITCGKTGTSVYPFTIAADFSGYCFSLSIRD